MFFFSLGNGENVFFFWMLMWARYFLLSFQRFERELHPVHPEESLQRSRGHQKPVSAQRCAAASNLCGYCSNCLGAYNINVNYNTVTTSLLWYFFYTNPTGLYTSNSKLSGTKVFQTLHIYCWQSLDLAWNPLSSFLNNLTDPPLQTVSPTARHVFCSLLFCSCGLTRKVSKPAFKRERGAAQITVKST